MSALRRSRPGLMLLGGIQHLADPAVARITNGNSPSAQLVVLHVAGLADLPLSGELGRDLHMRAVPRSEIARWRGRRQRQRARPIVAAVVAGELKPVTDELEPVVAGELEPVVADEEPLLLDSDEVVLGHALPERLGVRLEFNLVQAASNRVAMVLLDVRH